MKKTSPPTIEDNKNTPAAGNMSEKAVVKHSRVQGTTCNTVHETNRRALQHLCLNVRPDVQWGELPESVRRLIVSRVLGLEADLNSEVARWLSENSTSLRDQDESLYQCLDDFEARQGKFSEDFSPSSKQGPELTSKYIRKDPSYTAIHRVARKIVHATEVTIKWVAIISGAAPDTNRELWYAMRNNKARPVLLWVLLKAWKVCWWVKNFWIYTFLFAGKRQLGRLLSLIRHGARRTLRSDTIQVDTPLWQVSGFIGRDQKSDLTVMTYDGLHSQPPEGKAPTAIAYYDSTFHLQKREVFGAKGSAPITTNYFHDSSFAHRWPSSKVTVESGIELKSFYDEHGRVTNGQLIRGDIKFNFEFLYRERPKGNTDILKATYTSIQGTSPISITAFWCVRPRVGSQTEKNWVPADKIQRVVATMNGSTYDMKWTYKHARDPEIHTSYLDNKGKLVPCMAPAPILQDSWGFQKKPKHANFDSEDLLIYHSPDWLKNVGRESSAVSAKVSTLR